MLRKTFQTLLTLALVALIAAPAYALDLGSAKSQGLVGEKADGMIGAVKSGNPEVDALVQQTNAGRMDVYRQQAGAQGVSIDQYKAVAGSKLIDRTPAGQYVNMGGGWVKK